MNAAVRTARFMGISFSKCPSSLQQVPELKLGPTLSPSRSAGHVLILIESVAGPSFSSAVSVRAALPVALAGIGMGGAAVRADRLLRPRAPVCGGVVRIVEFRRLGNREDVHPLVPQVLAV